LEIAMTFRAVSFALAAAVSTVGYAGAWAAGNVCPAFTEIRTGGITNTDRVASFPGGVVAKVAELRIDTDGAATAYHPDNIGSSSLCDGVQAYVDGRCVSGSQCEAAVRSARAANWVRERSPALCIFGFEAPSRDNAGDKILWGGRYGTGPLPVQGPGDPAPGFFVSTTPRPLRSPVTNRIEYADADRLPYIVAPSSLTGKTGPTGMLAMAGIVRTSDGHVVHAIVADSGGALGEVSVAAAQLTRSPDVKEPRPVTEAELRGTATPLPYPYEKTHGRIGATNNPDQGPYLVFAFSSRYGRAARYTLSVQEVKAQAGEAFKAFGGEQFLTSCAQAYFTTPTAMRSGH
jgi:hypothetical protein